MEPLEVLDEAAMMKAVDKLMKHEDLQRIDHKGFKLLVDFGDEILEELNLIAKEHKGSVVYDSEVVEEATKEDIKALFEKMGKR